MKQLWLKDCGGSGALYRYYCPDRMEEWTLAGFLDCLCVDAEALAGEGYLARPADPLRHAELRELLFHPEQSLNAPIQFAREGKACELIRLEEELTVVELQREAEAALPDPSGLDLRARNRRVYEGCRPTLDGVFERLFELDSFPAWRAEFPGLDPDAQIRFIHQAACKLYEAPFENVSKIDHRLPFRSGLGMWLNLDAGYGGVCGEKTSALMALCDLLGLDTRPVLGAHDPLPDDLEAQYRAFAAGAGAGEAPPWVQHHLLEIAVGGRRILVDATNGNIPFLFVEGADREQLLASRYRARMVYQVERLHLVPASPLLGDLLLSLSEFQVPDLYFKYIFDQGLGLHISRDLYLGVYFDWGGDRASTMEHYYTAQARRLRLPCPRFIHSGNTGSVPDEAMRKLLERTRSRLWEQQPDPAYTGDFTFVFQALDGAGWRAPRISASLKASIDGKGGGKI